MSVRRVKVYLEVDGTDMYPRVADYVKRISFSDDAKEKTKSRLSITFADPDGKFSDDPSFMRAGTVINAGLVVREGDKTSRVPFGRFSVTRCSGSRLRELEVSAVSYVPDRSKLRVVQNKHFENVSIKDVLSSLITSAGFQPVLDGVPELVYDRIDVKNQSIEDFIKDVAFRLGLEFFVKGDKVIVGTLKSAPEVEIDINKPPVIDMSYELDTRKSYSKIVVKYHKFEENKTLEYEHETGLPGEVYYHVERVGSIEEAKEVAKGLARKLNQRTGSVRLVCKGFPIWAGNRVILKGVKRFEGRYLVERATHNVDSSAEWRTELELKLALS